VSSVDQRTPAAGGWLAGKRALVVGAGSGIGRAVCDAFVAEGASIAALELDHAKCEELLSALPASVVVEGDATTLADNRRAVEAALDAYGGLDILVSTVGVFDFYRGIGELDGDLLEAAFEEMFATNVRSQLFSVKAALPALAASGGNVVLTASTSSFFPGRGGVLYVSSKFAVRGLVVALAHELAPRVRVNAVAPGGTVGTDLRGLAALDLGKQRLDDRAGRAADLVQRTPLAVALEPDDHAASYVFLASDRARGITGTFVHSDGGIGVKA
jgi:NAD(P)-dependent dehydrogenase (short-subunit alcohol dehydrogenase family)